MIFLKVNWKNKLYTILYSIKFSFRLFVNKLLNIYTFNTIYTQRILHLVNSNLIYTSIDYSYWLWFMKYGLFMIELLVFIGYGIALLFLKCYTKLTAFK